MSWWGIISNLSGKPVRPMFYCPDLHWSSTKVFTVKFSPKCKGFIMPKSENDPLCKEIYSEQFYGSCSTITCMK